MLKCLHISYQINHNMKFLKDCYSIFIEKKSISYCWLCPISVDHDCSKKKSSTFLANKDFDQKLFEIILFYFYLQILMLTGLVPWAWGGGVMISTKSTLHKVACTQLSAFLTKWFLSRILEKKSNDFWKFNFISTYKYEHYWIPLR